MRHYTFKEGDPQMVEQFNALAAEAVGKGRTVGQLHDAVLGLAAIVSQGGYWTRESSWKFLHDGIRRSLFGNTA
jgi:hypothetical protein